MAKEKKEKKEKKDKEEKKKEKKEKKDKKEKKEKKGKKGKEEKEEKEEKPKKGKKGKKDKKEKPEKPKKEKKKKKKKGKKGEPEEPETEEVLAEQEDEGKKGKKGKKDKKKKSAKKDDGKEPKKAGSTTGKGAPEAEGENPEGAEGAEEAAEQYPWFNLSWAALHILAMVFMLCDSLWITVLPGTKWVACLGRLAYPLFAFLLVEGFFHTQNLWLYLLRLLGVAVLAELPFNLLYGGSIVYPIHQNVIWTFIIGLLFIILLEEFKDRYGQLPTMFFAIIPALMGYFLGQVLMTDYYGAGVLIILMFYLFRGRHWGNLLAQLICLWFISFKLVGGYYYIIPSLGYDFEVVQQGLAVLSLIPIWLYWGRQGFHGKIFRLFCYLFYPVHMLLLFIIRFKS